MRIFQSLFGVMIFLLIAFYMSEERKKIHYKNAIISFSAYIIFTILILRIPAVSLFLMKANGVLQAIAQSSIKGAEVVFGKLAIQEHSGFVLALQSLPVLITVSALSALLIKLRILPIIIRAMSRFFQLMLRINGTLGIAVSANIFAGMAETPLVVTPYLMRMSRSEIFSLMVCGAAGLSSSVIILLGMIANDVYPDAVIHIMSAVLMSIPGSILISRIIVPETRQDIVSSEKADLHKDGGIIEAVFNGIMNGGKIMMTIIVMLIGFIALIDVINTCLLLLPEVAGEPLSIARILGWLLSPITWLIGIDSCNILKVSSLIGAKFAFNEIIAFQEFAKIADQLDVRTKTILIYSLSGFANIGSVGVLMGVYSALVPQRKEEVMS